MFQPRSTQKRNFPVRTGFFVAFAVVLLLLPPAESARTAQLPKNQPLTSGSVLVLDNCDTVYEGKAAYEDNLSLIDGSGKLVFRITGFNNCESIGSNHMIARDGPRGWFWVMENVGHRIRKLDRTGKELLVLKNLQASAMAVHPPTGNLWVLTSRGQINGDQTLVFNAHGKQLAAYSVSGWDIAYDARGGAFWIVSSTLVKVKADNGHIAFTKNISTWCASSVAVHPATGKVWVAVRQHPNVAQSANELLGFDNDGNLTNRIALGDKTPFKVSLDTERGTVWVALFGKGVSKYSAEGKFQAEFPRDVRTIAADVVTGGVWVSTPQEVVLLNQRGDMVRSIRNKSNSSQAWMVGW